MSDQDMARIARALLEPVDLPEECPPLIDRILGAIEQLVNERTVARSGEHDAYTELMKVDKALKGERFIVPIPTVQAVLADTVPEKHQRSLMRDMAHDLLKFWGHSSNCGTEVIVKASPMDTFRNEYFDYLEGGREGPPSLDTLSDQNRQAAKDWIGSLNAARGIDPFAVRPSTEEILKKVMEFRLGPRLVEGLTDEEIEASATGPTIRDEHEAMMVEKVLQSHPRAREVDTKRLKEMGLVRHEGVLSLDPEVLDVQPFTLGDDVTKGPTAVRIIHRPTMKCVEAAERSQYASRAKATAELTKVVLAHWREKAEAVCRKLDGLEGL